MPDNKFDSNNSDKSLLSDMINEYESDNPLRDKIEAAKKRKAMEEEALKQAEIQRRLDDIQREKEARAPKQPAVELEPTVPFINADADATQVFQAETKKPIDDGDQTLVIMDNMKQRDFNAGTNTINTSQSAKLPEPKPERLAPEFEVEGEIITEQDIEEYLPKDSKKPKQAKKPGNPDRMNKIVTYTIAGIAGLCVIGLVVFALNFFGVFGGGSTEHKTLTQNEVTIDEKVNFEEIGANNFSLKGAEVTNVTDATLIKLANAEAISTKDKTTVQITTVDKKALKDTKGTYTVSFATNKGTKVSVKATVTESKVEETKKDPVVDNSAKKSELTGQIKSYNDQIATLKADIATLDNTINGGPEAKAKIENNYAEQRTSLKRASDDAQTKLNTANANLEAAKATKDPAKIDAATKEQVAAQTVFDSAFKKYNDLESEILNLTSAVDNEVSSATNDKITKTASINDLQSKIIDLQNQLNALK